MSFVLVSCNQDKSDTIMYLTGNIKGLKKGTLYIKKINDTLFTTLDSIVIDGNSSFKTTMKLGSPEMLYLFLNRGQSNNMDNYLLFFAEPGKITIETGIENFAANVKITGSKNQELYEEYKKMIRKFNDEQLDLIEANFNAVKEENDYKIDSIKQKYDKLVQRRRRYAINFALHNANYEIGPYIALVEAYDVHTKYLDTIKKAMTTQIANSLYGKKLIEYIAGRVE